MVALRSKEIGLAIPAARDEEGEGNEVPGTQWRAVEVMMQA
jgi:hypothetical protein